jgi:hypothetical protein
MYRHGMNQALRDDAVRLLRIRIWCSGELMRIGLGPFGPSSNRLEDHNWWQDANGEAFAAGPLDPREEAVRECARWLREQPLVPEAATAAEVLLEAMGVKP